MTSGQQRAARELRRLHAADPDAGFDFVVPPEMVDGALVTVVDLRIGHVETATGGLDLRDREEFFLRVPPDFPFRPSRSSSLTSDLLGFHTLSGHTRFAYTAVRTIGIRKTVSTGFFAGQHMLPKMALEGGTRRHGRGRRAA